MAKQKKINTLDLIQQMTAKKKDNLAILKDIKNERTQTTTAQHNDCINVSERKENRSARKERKTKAEPDKRTNAKDLDGFVDLLVKKHFLDRKQSFMMVLSKTCLGKYEELALGISYKLGIKTTRNDLIRKVLEDFMYRNYDKMKKGIEQHG